MLVLGARAVLATLLVGAALLKLAAGDASRGALATFGVHAERAQRALWVGLIAAESALAAGVVAGSDLAAYLAAGMQLLFAAAVGRALASGRAGAPCGCFGARSRVGPVAVVRNLALAGAFAALPSLPRPSPSTEDWLTLGLAVALFAVAGLAVAVLALARQVGELRVAVGPQSALEIPDEGPPVGERTEFIERFRARPGARLALAVFSSEGCPACSSLGPTISVLERDPVLSVRSFDEHRDADAWGELRIPGAPYAVALGLDGTVLAKGTFNTLPQLESVLGTAERRAAELVHA